METSSALRLYWLPNQTGAWLAWDDDEGCMWIVPNKRAGWQERKQYRGSVLPTERSRVAGTLERIVREVTGMPGAEPLQPRDLVWLGNEVCETSRASQADELVALALGATTR